MATTSEKSVNASPRLSSEHADWYKARFKTLNSGAEWALATMAGLAQSTIAKDIVGPERGPYDIEGALIWASEAVPRLAKQTLARELRGKFTRGELSMILDVLNGHGMAMRMSPHTPGQHIGLSIHDSFEIYPGSYEEKWGVDKAHMLETLKECTVFQLAALEYWAAMFWEGDYNAPDAMEKACAILEVPK